MSDDPIPENAERLRIDDYLRTETKPSVYIRGASSVWPVFTCPSCNSRQMPPTAFKSMSCTCGITVQWRDPYLYVWPTDTSATV